MCSCSHGLHQGQSARAQEELSAGSTIIKYQPKWFSPEAWIFSFMRLFGSIPLFTSDHNLLEGVFSQQANKIYRFLLHPRSCPSAFWCYTTTYCTVPQLLMDSAHFSRESCLCLKPVAANNLLLTVSSWSFKSFISPAIPQSESSIWLKEFPGSRHHSQNCISVNLLNLDSRMWVRRFSQN